MPDAIETLLIKIAADVGEFVSGVNQAASEAERGGTRISRAFTNVGQGLENAGRNLRRLGTGLSIGVTAPILAFARSSVTAFMASEDAIASVEAVLATMGETAGFTSGQLAEMAAAMQRTTKFDDDDILRNVTANLLTFGNVQGEVFERAQATALDLSELLGQDLQSAAIMLGKALNDPVRGLSALTRVGVVFSDESRALITSLSEGGDAAGAQAVMLAELERQYGLVAERAAETTSGALAQMNNRWGDFQETIGEIITQMLPPLLDQLNRILDWLETLSPETKQWAVQIALLAAALGPVLIVLGSLLSVLGMVSKAVGLLWLAAGGPWTLAIAAIVLLGATIFHFRDDIWEAITSAWAKVEEFATWLFDNFPIFFLDAMVAAIGHFWDFVAWISEGVAGVPGIVASFAGDMVNAGIELIQGLWDGIKALFENMMEWVRAKAMELVQPFIDAANFIKGLFGAGGEVDLNTTIAPTPEQLQQGAGTAGRLESQYPGLFDNLDGARAEGGPVRAGGTYLVGEKGPELLKMGGLSGNVMPGGQQQGGGMAGAATGLAGAIGEQFSGLVETILSPIAALQQLVEAFQLTYDELVGHSIVPDMQQDMVDWYRWGNEEITNDTIESMKLVEEAHRKAAELAKDAMSATVSNLKKLGSTLFGDSKAWAIAEIIISTAQAVMKTLSQYGATPWGIAAAATAAAAGLAQLASVKSASKGGGSIAGVGGMAAEAQASAPMPQTLFVQGINPNMFYSGDQVRELANSLLQYQKDGGKVVWEDQ